MNGKKIISLCVFILILLCGGFVSSYLTMGNITKMFHEIAKPEWSPPSRLFAPVWTVLYIMIAVSGWLVWEAKPHSHFEAKPHSHFEAKPHSHFEAKPHLGAFPFALYVFQLALNFAWTFIYFGMGEIGLAFIDICLLDISVIALIFVFKKYSVWASVLLVPYLFWLLFATALNYKIMTMN